MNRLQNKIFNHEEAPPTNAWEKIAHALDESNLENKFPSKLYNTEVNPSPSAWQKITEALNTEKFDNDFASRVYDMEVGPPATAWENISLYLNTSKPTSTIVKKLTPFIRYAAAAIVIGAVAFGVIKLTVNNNTQKSTVLTTPSKDGSKNDEFRPADNGAEQIPSAHRKEREELAERSKKLAAVPNRSIKKATRAASASVIVNSSSNDDFTDANLYQSIYAYADHIPDIADRYVMLMTPDGNIIRMSKKWSDLLCCVSGEEQDADCKYQLKKWQEKMATSTLAPSPGNFLDILSLVNSLDESSGL
jgi:hypothetical protein